MIYAILGIIGLGLFCSVYGLGWWILGCINGEASYAFVGYVFWGISIVLFVICLYRWISFIVFNKHEKSDSGRNGLLFDDGVYYPVVNGVVHREFPSFSKEDGMTSYYYLGGKKIAEGREFLN